MRPIKKTILVKMIVWDCGNQSHRHRSKEVAEACMATQARRAGQPTQDQITATRRARWIGATRDVLSGASLAKTGEKFGASDQTVRYWVDRVWFEISRLKDAGGKPRRLGGIDDMRRDRDALEPLIAELEQKWGVLEFRERSHVVDGMFDSILSLPISQRAKNCLIEAGFESIEKIRGTSDSALLSAHRSLGVKTLREIRAAIANFDASKAEA